MVNVSKIVVRNLKAKVYIYFYVCVCVCVCSGISVTVKNNNLCNVFIITGLQNPLAQ